MKLGEIRGFARVLLGLLVSVGCALLLINIPPATAALLRQSVPTVVDPTEDTTVTTVELTAGFVLDPYIVRVIGSGDNNASELAATCTGFVDLEPDVILHWRGEADALSVFVYSDGDPVLAVETPMGEILCNDDAGLETVDPMVTIEQAVPGTYQVYVGSYVEDDPVLGFLGITAAPIDAESLTDLDLSPMLDRKDYPDETALSELRSSDLLIDEEAVFGASDLTPDFEPMSLYVAGGGDMPAMIVANSEQECGGFFSLVPTYSFTWSDDTGSDVEPGEGSNDLKIWFESADDSSLITVTPSGEIQCNLNSTEANLNPSLQLIDPQDGSYDIYVGSGAPRQVVGGTLTISSDIETGPGLLPPAE